MLFPKRRRSIWPYLAIPFIVTLLVGRCVHLPLSSRLNLFRGSGSVQQHLRSERVAAFWADLHRELRARTPGIETLKKMEMPANEYMDPNAIVDGDRPRANLLKMKRQDVESMQRSHDIYVAALESLGNRLPYWPNTKGIVMTAGGTYMGTALTSLAMLRQSGSKLPVHLFIDTREEYDHLLCDVILPKLDVQCLVMEEILGDTKAEKYQYKILSILFSPLQEVLFLDSDAWPIHNPDNLFGAEPYISHGLVTWPDFWLGTVSPLFFEISRTENTMPVDMRSSESGIMLYNKKVHAESLLLATYYNWYGPGYYYTLFSQGAHGEGDKETFLYAAAVLNKPYYNVRQPVGILGRWMNGSFDSVGMKQHDPVEDYSLELYRKHRKTHGEDKDKTEREEERTPRPLFIHHNLWKMDLRIIGNTESPIYRTDEKGRYMRLWGDDDKLIERSGYDVEMELWKKVVEMNCQMTFLMECKGVLEYYHQVFGDT
jgi:alpha 1,2-mannosyltransferase